MARNLYTPTAATFSKSPDMWGHNFWPTSINSGYGARVFDSAGKSYIDWVCGLGANILGHGNMLFTQHVATAIDKGLAFSLPSYNEELVAYLLTKVVGSRIPGFNIPLQIRFGSTGTDACAASVRLARAITKKNLILSSGYHGWSSEFVCLTEPAWGITPDTSKYIQDIKFNNLEDLPDRDDVAAIIIEQGIEEPNPDYYASLREYCDKHQALLIIDEVVTGLRFGLGGACEKYSIYPDIVCMGKALGNGLPISCIMAPKEYMDWFAREDPVFALSSTTNANPASLAAAEFMLNNFMQSSSDYLSTIGHELKTGLKSQGFDVVGQNERFIIRWSSELEHAFFVKKIRDSGILANRPFFGTICHTHEMVTETLDAATKIREELDFGHPKVDGYPKVLFRSR